MCLSGLHPSGNMQGEADQNEEDSKPSGSKDKTGNAGVLVSKQQS